MGVPPSSGGAVFSTGTEESTARSSAARASAESSFSPCTGSSTGAAFFCRSARLVLGGAGSPAVSETVSAGGPFAPSADKLEGVSSSPSPSSPAADPAGSSKSEGAPEAVPSFSGAASSDASVSINSRGGSEPSKVASPSGCSVEALSLGWSIEASSAFKSSLSGGAAASAGVPSKETAPSAGAVFSGTGVSCSSNTFFLVAIKLKTSYVLY